MRILRNYLFSTIVGKVLLVLTVLLALASFIELIGQLDDLGEGSYGLTEAIFSVLLKVPAKAYVAMPIAVMIGALLGLGTLASGSEIVVLRAGGVSTARLAMAVGMTGAVLALATLVLGDFLGPSLEHYARQYRTLAKSGQAGLQGGGAAWVRDGDTFIHLGIPDQDLRYGGVYLYRFEEGELAAIARADSVDVGDDDQWVMNNFSESRFLDEGVAVHEVARLVEPKNLNAELLALMEVRPTTLTSVRLARYIQYLKDNDLNSRRYEVVFWSRIANSIAVIPMCILALPFCFGSLRSSGTGGRLVVGLIIGLGYFLGSQTLGDGGAVFGIAPAVVAAMPTLILTVVTLGMLARAR